MYDITRCVIAAGSSTQLSLSVVGSRASFQNLSRWLADARALASPHLVTVLVGNKSDREEDREVEWAEASQWAAENGACASPCMKPSVDRGVTANKMYISSKHLR